MDNTRKFLDLKGLEFYTAKLRNEFNAKLHNITREELLNLKNSSSLIPGMQYRITDYECTTTQFDTKSAEHGFDIVVTADNYDTLNENVRAIRREGDTYFNDSRLESWELKYCIDNDTKRFAWADTNGFGVVYWMKDEWGNECPYDFKNIQFKRYKVKDSSPNGELLDLSD